MSRRPRTVETVEATPEEVAEWCNTHGGAMPHLPRVRCKRCGARLWSSGSRVAAHQRSKSHQHAVRSGAAYIDGRPIGRATEYRGGFVK